MSERPYICVGLRECVCVCVCECACVLLYLYPRVSRPLTPSYLTYVRQSQAWATWSFYGAFMQLLYSFYAAFMLLLCSFYTDMMLLLCCFYAAFMQLLCSFYAAFIQLFRSYFADFMKRTPNFCCSSALTCWQAYCLSY